MGFDLKQFKCQLTDGNIDTLLEDSFKYKIDTDVSSSLSNVFMLLSLMFRYPTEKVYNELFVNFENFRLFFEEYLGEVPSLPYQEDLEPEYVSLFVARKGGIPAPLYASVYNDNEMLLLRDSTLNLKALMKSSGFEIGDDVKEIEDNLYIMLEFISAVFSKLSVEAECQKEMLSTVSTVLTVVNDYVGKMSKPFGEKIRESASMPFYKMAEEILNKVIDDFDALLSELIDIEEIQA